MKKKLTIIGLIKEHLAKKLDLNTPDFDKVSDPLTQEEFEGLFNDFEPLVSIFPVTPKALEIISNNPDSEIISEGTNWKAAFLSAKTWEELEEANQAPYFDYYYTIDDFRNA